MKFNLLASVSTLALGGVMAAALPSPAEATLVCTTATSSCTETIDFGNTKADFGILGTLDQFNKGAGFTLTSVVVSDSGIITSAGTITNTSSKVSQITFQAGITLTLAPGTGAPASFPSLAAGKSFIPTQTFPNVGIGASVVYKGTGAFNTGSSKLTTALSGYVGTGSFQVLATGGAVTRLGISGGNGNASVVTFGDLTATITYNYSVTTPVPEPASLAVLGAGLTGLGLLRRRRRT